MRIWSPKPWQIGLVVVIGVFGISTAAIFVRLAFTAAGVQSVGFSLVLSAARLTISAILLLPAWRHLRSSPPSDTSVYYTLIAGICLSLHFATWITSLAFTSIAAASTLVSSTPIWVALLAWLWLREKLSPITLVGVGVALAGGIIIALEGSGIDSVASDPLLGNFLALFGAWMYGLYLLLGRKAQQEGLGLGSYITIAYTTGAFILLPLPSLFGASYTGYPSIVYVYILSIALFSQMIGHTSLNWGMRWLSPTFVTLAALFEPVGASFLAYFLFDELPGRFTLLGAAILLVGVACAIAGARQK